MNAASFLRYRLHIEPLTPFHVGAGTAIEPYDYDTVQDTAGCWLMVIDLAMVVADALPARRTEFEQFSRRADFRSLRRWLRENAVPARHCRWRVRVAPAAFAEIRGHLDDPARLGEIHLFLRDAATGVPYLPGSSIKGAIRTAIVDAAARENKARMPRLEAVARDADRDRWVGPRFEAAAMGNTRPDGGADLYRDPLRQIAIADVPLPADACCIDRIHILRQHEETIGDPGGIVIYRDLAGAGLGQGSFEFAGELRVHRLLADRQRMGDAVLPRKLEAAAICRACNDFYRPRLEEELHRFVRDATLKARLRTAAEAVAANQCLLRLGRHSHFECVTVGEPFRRSPRRGYGKTRSYIGGQVPLGWLLVTMEADMQ